MTSLSDAQVLLLAAQYSSEPDLRQLELLAAEHQSLLTPRLLYRILITYLPADPTIENSLCSFLHNLKDGFTAVNPLDTDLNTTGVKDAFGHRAEEKLRALHLEQLTPAFHTSSNDGITDFLVAWTLRVENVNGLTTSTLRLIDNFTSDAPQLTRWKDAILVPLFRLQNEYYPGQADTLTIQELETLHGTPGVSTLLQFAENVGPGAEIGRDLENVIVPWVSGSNGVKRRKLGQESRARNQQHTTTWADVDEWIVLTSKRQYGLAAKSLLEWNGPHSESEASSDPQDLETDTDSRIHYVQTVLAVAYLPDEVEPSDLGVRKTLLRRSAFLADLISPDTEALMPNISEPTSMSRASRGDLLENALLRPGNPLTTPSTDALEFLYGTLATQNILEEFKMCVNPLSVASSALFDSEDKQKQELHAILAQIPRLTKTHVSWEDVRRRLVWLRSWRDSSGNETALTSKIAYLGRLTQQFLDTEILNAILITGDFNPVISIFLKVDEAPLPHDTVLSSVVAAVYSAYDNASNGNRTRGGIKRASDLLKSFGPHFPTSPILRQIEYLIKATHSLSFYQLTLQHGVPFRPVNIRVHRDPLSLIGKVLEQNPSAYTKLDDLLGIARNLVKAELSSSKSDNASVEDGISVDERLFDAEHRVTYSAITSALTEHDFDTAYSYITTRLSTSPSQSQDSQFTDDTSWRAAYAAGKYRPSAVSPNIHQRISSLSKRMDLLSLALTLAPTPDPLSEILGTWRRCEEEMDSLKSQALEEERTFEAGGEDIVPGGFGPDDRDLDAAETRRMMQRRALASGAGPSYEEEAPMGLFDVARGAASAVRKSAFPLRGAQGLKIQNQSRASTDGGRGSIESVRPGSAGGDGEQRVRKRDMISNAVTGGLVSGMSWVLGTQPVNRSGEQEQ